MWMSTPKCLQKIAAHSRKATPFSHDGAEDTKDGFCNIMQQEVLYLIVSMRQWGRSVKIYSDDTKH